MTEDELMYGNFDQLKKRWVRVNGRKLWHRQNGSPLPTTQTVKLVKVTDTSLTPNADNVKEQDL